MPCYYLTPEQDDSNQELQICIAEALYDVDSIVADPGAYTKEQLIISLTAPTQPFVRQFTPSVSVHVGILEQSRRCLI